MVLRTVFGILLISFIFTSCQISQEPKLYPFESGDGYRGYMDAKGRIVIPARFRDAFTEQLVVTKGFEGCLNIYTMDQFEKIATNLERLPSTKKDARQYVRLFISKAVECEIDSQNRINLPLNLMKEAGIEKRCVFIGAVDHIELWSLETWEAWYRQNSDNFAEVAESITDLLQ